MSTNLMRQNVGPDVSVLFLPSYGGSFTAEQLGHLKSINAKDHDGIVTTKTITNRGAVLNQVIPQSGVINTTWARMNGAFLRMLNQYRINWKAGIETYFTIQTQTRNSDGSIDTVQYRYCKPANADHGDYKADSDVQQSCEFLYQDYIITQ